MSTRSTGRGTRPGHGGYDAFMSYSHAADASLAPGLQKGLQLFAKPWYARRGLRVFRDEASLSADPDLWRSVERGLQASAWFICLASPDSAASAWVAREISWWLDNRGPDTILLVVTGGRLPWEPVVPVADVTDESATEPPSALPPALQAAVEGEPRWVDLRWARAATDTSLRHPRFRECVADIAAPLRGVPKDDLIGEEVRQHRRALRLARAAVVSLCTLLVAAVVAAAVAVEQRGQARAEARVASARALAASSGNELPRHADLGQLLAVEAYRLHPDTMTRGALLRSVFTSPQLAWTVQHPEEVAKVAASGDGAMIAVGGAAGSLRVLSADGSTLWDPPPLPARTWSLAVDATGEVVAAADTDGHVQVAHRNGALRSHPAGPGRPGSAAIVALAADASVLFIADGAGPRLVKEPLSSSQVIPLDLGDLTPGVARFTADASALTVTAFDGSQRTIALPSQRTISEVSQRLNPAGFYIPAASANLEHYGLAKDGFVVVRSQTTEDEPVFPAAPLAERAFAVADGGRRVAVGTSEAVSVLDADDSPGLLELPLPLAGAAPVDGLLFPGAGEELISWSGSRVTWWDLAGAARSADVIDYLPDHSGPDIPVRHALSRDGRFLAWAADELVLFDLLEWREVARSALPGGEGAGLRFSDEGSRLVLTPEGGAAEGLSQRLVATRRARVFDTVDLTEVGDLVLPGAPTQIWPARGTDVVVTAPEGLIGRWDTVTGVLVETLVEAPDGVELRDVYTSEVQDGTRGQLARASDDRVEVVNLGDGRTRTFPLRQRRVEAWDEADRLWTATRDGLLEALDPRSGRVVVRLDPRASYASVRTGDEGRLLVGVMPSGRIDVWDVSSTQLLLSFTVPLLRDEEGAEPGVQTEVSVVPGRQALVSSTAGGVLAWWDLEPAALIARACASVGWDLSGRDWRRYAPVEPPSHLQCDRR
ncbi:toll/interleukin-1 receptor domain-containing protein [Kineococcus glutinatus]|uniref:toll/interleukin-1 receptor domain-containing protein n=1 Tax=Kineococcus glutinatus TaxID=1070872 RepID=UPI0031EC85D3